MKESNWHFWKKKNNYANVVLDNIETKLLYLLSSFFYSDYEETEEDHSFNEFNVSFKNNLDGNFNVRDNDVLSDRDKLVYD